VLKSRIAKYLQIISYGLALLSFVYIYRIAKTAVVERPVYTATTYAIIFILCGASSVLPFVSAYIWKLVVELVSRRTMLFDEAIVIYLRANIAKYLPGNVMQYVGRNYVGANYGWRHTHLVLSSILEIICLVVIPFSILTAFYLGNLWTLPDSYSVMMRSFLNSGVLAVVGTLLVLAFVALVAYGARNTASIKNLRQEFELHVVASKLGITVSKITLLSIASMFANTLLFFSIGSKMFGIHFRGGDFVNVACALTVAGYAGILTPGLPGGVGVKESLSVLLISAYGYEKAGLAIVLVGARALSVVGDVVAFLIAMRLKKRFDEATGASNNPGK